MKNTITPRYPFSMAVKEDVYRRIMKLREAGYTTGDILLLGIKQAEIKNERADKKQ